MTIITLMLDSGERTVVRWVGQDKNIVEFTPETL